MTYVCLFILCALEKELSQAFGTHNIAAALPIRNMAQLKRLYTCSESPFDTNYGGINALFWGRSW